MSASVPAVKDLARLEEIAATRSWLQGTPQAIAVTRDGSAVLFLRSGPRDRVQDLYLFDVAKGTTRTLATTDSLLAGKAEALTAEELARRERQRIASSGITSFTIAPDGKHALVPLSGRLYLVALADGAARALPGVEDALDARFSPDGKKVGYVRDHDLWVHDLAAGGSRAVTTGGTAEISHGEAEFVAQEEMDRFTGWWWSPASDAVLWQESDTRAVESHFIADPAAPATPPQSWKYPRPGKANAIVRLAYQRLDAAPGRHVWLEWDRVRFPYLATVRWDEGGGPLLVVQSRDQRDAMLMAIDLRAKAIKVEELLRERDETWVSLRQKVPRRAGGRGLVWMSEADGEWRIALHDARGARIRVLNPGNEFRLADLVHLDEAGGRVIVSGTHDPVEKHLWELSLDGAAPRALTKEPGEHETVVAERGGVRVDTFTSLEKPPVSTVRRADGSVAGVLPSVAAAAKLQPRVELTRVTIAGRVHDAAVVRPIGASTTGAGVGAGTLPVIVHVYGGPGDGVVHRSLVSTNWHRLQWFADQGFVVVAIENRGIRNRGRAWERAIHRDLGTAPIEDQVAVLQALAKDRSEMDLGRVGIMGWSYGGFMSALAVARRGDVFHAAVAGAPVTEWRDYDTHYTERYLGMPEEDAKAYDRSSVMPYAGMIARPLLLIHGTADDNVYFEHSLKLADAMFRAGKRFELVPIAGATHMAPRIPQQSVLIDRRSAEFFLEHLGGSR